MNTDTISDALQELIIRLQDAEKGYLEIKKATANTTLRNWMEKYAGERHKMHQKLEGHVAARGDSAEVKTSILGELHRIFIDIKLSATDDNIDAIVTEVDRGASRLIEDYDTILDKMELPLTLKQELIYQKSIVENELEELKILQKELNSVNA